MDGATVQRGRVVYVDATGACVENPMRDGMISRPLRSDACDIAALQIGDYVFYVEFDDGRGTIIGRDYAEQ